MTVLRLSPATLRPAVLTPPASKSDAQRALVLGRILGRPALTDSLTHEASLPADVSTLASGLRAIDSGGGEWTQIDCRDGGAPFRLLLTQAAVTPGAKVRFTGTARLAERPHGPLLAALEAALGPAGLRITGGPHWPLSVEAPRQSGEAVFRIDPRQSSQYVSSLLLGACALQRREGRSWRVELTGPLASEGYLELTLSWAARAGFRIRRSESAFTVEGHEDPAQLPTVPGDWSSLGYLLLLAWASGGTAARADESALHPDRAIVSICEQVGLRVLRDPGQRLAVTGTPQRGLSASGEVCPDLLPTLAAFSCVLPLPSTLSEVEILRGKESDRLAGVVALVEAAGGRAERQATGELLIVPPSKVQPLIFHSRGDHRLAMSAATLAVLARVPLELTDPDCVDKSFPGFYDELGKIGCQLDRRS